MNLQKVAGNVQTITTVQYCAFFAVVHHEFYKQFNIEYKNFDFSKNSLIRNKIETHWIH